MRKFYVGLHQTSDGLRVGRPSCFSIMRLVKRRSEFCKEFIVDSGGFNEVRKFGSYRMTSDVYAMNVREVKRLGGLVWAAQQDFMCEPDALAATGLSVRDHQLLTIDRFIDNLRFGEVVPIIQGDRVKDFHWHATELRKLGRFDVVGVGSVCTRKSRSDVNEIVDAVRSVFWNSWIHGFGVKIGCRFDSGDSMAWSLNQRKNGRNPNCWKAAQEYYDKVVSGFGGD